MKLIFLALALSAVTAVDIPPSCQKPLYCSSELLHYVQMERIFPDSKTFVDLQLKQDENTILLSFEQLLNQTNHTPTKQQLEEFLNLNFASVNELESWMPLDFNPDPSFIYKIKDIRLRQFAKDINNIWPILGRKVNSAVFGKPESFSLIPVQNGFIVPGEKFKEFYYWDTYWIVEGLLVSGMRSTVKGIISNLIELQRQFGHIPSGNRYYYQQRSQPPLLSAMMKLYVEETHDIDFLKANLDALEGELQYWLDTQSIAFNKDGKEHTLLRYYAPSNGPRPESYYEDYTQANAFESEDRKREFYVDVKSAAESGWDFSSRWFVSKDGSNIGNLTSVYASHIIPVDLNAIFINALQNIANFNGILHNTRKAAHWAHIAKHWRNSLKEVLFNDEDGIWYDWDLSNEHHRKYFYPSNIAPLWMDVVDQEFIKEKGQNILEYMKKTDSLNFPGGIPTSLIRSGERWDFPNAWPPLVSIVCKSLEALQTQEAKHLAFEVAQNWIRSNYKGYVTSKKLLEKYNVEYPGRVDVEAYENQTSYGWTVGTLLQMLAKYGKVLTGQEGYYDFNEYKKNLSFWHIPTSAFLPLHYKVVSQNAAPVLTHSLPSNQFYNHFTSSQLEQDSSKPQHVEHQAQPIKGEYNQIVQVIPLPSVELIAPVALKPEALPLKPEQPEFVSSGVSQLSQKYTVPTQTAQISVAQLKPEYLPSQNGQAQAVLYSTQPAYIGNNQVSSSSAEEKPIPSAPVAPEVIISKPVTAYPTLLPAPAKPEQISSVPTPSQPEYNPSVPVPLAALGANEVYPIKPAGPSAEIYHLPSAAISSFSTDKEHEQTKITVSAQESAQAGLYQPNGYPVPANTQSAPAEAVNAPAVAEFSVSSPIKAESSEFGLGHVSSIASAPVQAVFAASGQAVSSNSVSGAAYLEKELASQDTGAVISTQGQASYQAISQPDQGGLSVVAPIQAESLSDRQYGSSVPAVIPSAHSQTVSAVSTPVKAVSSQNSLSQSGLGLAGYAVSGTVQAGQVFAQNAYKPGINQVLTASTQALPAPSQTGLSASAAGQSGYTGSYQSAASFGSANAQKVQTAYLASAPAFGSAQSNTVQASSAQVVSSQTGLSQAGLSQSGLVLPGFSATGTVSAESKYTPSANAQPGYPLNVPAQVSSPQFSVFGQGSWNGAAQNVQPINAANQASYSAAGYLSTARPQGGFVSSAHIIG